MIQEILPHHFDNAFHIVEPKATDFFFYFYEDKILLNWNGVPSPSIPQLCDLIHPPSKDSMDYLFTMDEFAFFEIHELSNTCDMKLYDMQIEVIAVMR